MEILAIIPARSGSKSIPHKNIAAFRGKPLIAHSIEHALASKMIHRVIVSTDSDHYAKIAVEHGAETPFLRPAEISGDLSTDIETFQHALKWLKIHENYEPDICVHLRPTCPNRSADEIDMAIQELIDNPSFDSVRSAAESPETPYKMWRMDDDSRLTPVVETDLHEPYNSPRQSLPRVYIQNAAIDVVRSEVILKQNSMTGKNIRGFIMDDYHDIDTYEQFGSAHAALAPELKNKKFVFDIDGVIATLTPENDYSSARPQKHVVDVINKLYDEGNKIILFTARGTETGIDWTETTKKQMADWGVSHHELKFGKPSGDYYIDDRSVLLHELIRFVSQESETGSKKGE